MRYISSLSVTIKSVTMQNVSIQSDTMQTVAQLRGTLLNFTMKSVTKQS